MAKSKILLIYTGGTIGMMQDAKTGSLKPFDFKSLTNQVPELKKFDVELSSISFEKPIDSSNMHKDVWVKPPTSLKKNTISSMALLFFMVQTPCRLRQVP